MTNIGQIVHKSYKIKYELRICTIFTKFVLTVLSKINEVLQDPSYSHFWLAFTTHTNPTTLPFWHSSISAVEHSDIDIDISRFRQHIQTEWIANTRACRNPATNTYNCHALPHYFDIKIHIFSSITVLWASYQIRKIAWCACAGNVGNVSPRRRLQRKLLVSDPGMHHGTCVTHVPWCKSVSPTRGGGEKVLGIPGACASASLRIW